MRPGSFVVGAASAAAWLAACLAVVWSAAALNFDFPIAPSWAAGLFVALVVVAAWLLRGRSWAAAIPLAASALVFAWWSGLEPSHDRGWPAEYSRLPWAEVDGDKVTIHEVRDFDYPADGTAVPRWATRTVRLDDLAGIDIAVNYWGSPWIAHPIVIFRFRGSEPIAFSIETRREENETYSALAGFFRQYELIVLAGSERDLLGVRAARREGEDVYLYSTTTAPDTARRRFLEYVATMNDLRDRPRWYNAVTSNCTTAIRSMNSGPRMPFDWRLLINGKADQMLYEQGSLQTDGLEFEELKRRAHANEAARAAFGGGDFSAAIREGRPGFGS